MNIADLDVLTCVRQTSADELGRMLDAGGFETVGLEGAGMSDGTGFRAAVQRDLPTSAGLDAHSWDALVDVLGDGIAGMAADRVALVWRNADHLERSNVQDFLYAVRALTDVTRHVYAHAGARQRHLLVFILGDGPSYPAF